MTSRTWSRTPISLALALAILCTYSMVGFAAPHVFDNRACAVNVNHFLAAPRRTRRARVVIHVEAAADER